MRWTNEPPPKKGDTRVRTAFLWLPLTIDQETRWLEIAKWEEGAVRSEKRQQWWWVPLRWVP